MSITLSTLSPAAIAENIGEPIPGRNGLIPNKARANKAAILAIAAAMPDVTLETLQTPEVRAAMLVAMADAGLCKSLIEAPFPTLSEAKASKEVKSFVSLPDGNALALKVDGHEYRAGGISPKNCPKYGGDAQAKLFWLTRRVSTVFSAALQTAQDAKKKLQTPPTPAQTTKSAKSKEKSLPVPAKKVPTKSKTTK